MASWTCRSNGLWERVAGTDHYQVSMQHLPVAAGAFGWVTFPSFLFMLGGKGNAFFYFTWENFSGSVSSLPQSVKRSAPGLYLRYTEFIALLNYRDPARALWFVLCLLSSCGEYGWTQAFPWTAGWQPRGRPGSIQRRTCLKVGEAAGRWGTLVQC